MTDAEDLERFIGDNPSLPDLRLRRGERGERGERLGEGSGRELVEGEEGGERPAEAKAAAGSVQNVSWSFSEFQA